MKRLLLFAIAILPLFSSNVTAQNSPTQPPLYTLDVFNDSLYVYTDTAAFTVDYALHHQLVDTSAAALDITGSNGLAVHPCTGEYYCIVKISGQSGRSLATIDVNSGICQIIGNTTENIAGIAFVNDTLLVGMSGDGGNSSETLYIIDINTAAITMVTSLSSGSDGETIAYCPDDGNLYRWSGRNTAPAMTRINPTTFTAVDLPLTGYNWDETFSATYVGNGNFLVSNLDQEFVLIDTSGFATNPVGSTYEYNRGLAFPSRYVWYSAAMPDSICPYGASPMDLIATSGADAYQWYKDGQPVAGATNDTLSTDMGGWYKCEITRGSCTAFSSDSIQVNVYPVDPAVVTPPTPEFCAGDSVLLTGNSGAGATEWWDGGTQLNSMTTYYATTGGTYSYVLYSANGCYDMVDVTVTENPNPMFTLSSTDELMGNDGTINLTVTGGTGLTFDWDNDGTGDFDDTEDLSGLTSGWYVVVVMAPTGCSATDSIYVGSQVGLEEFGAGADLKIYPNPNEGVFTVELVNMNIENMSLKISNAAGQTVMESDFETYALPVDIKAFGTGMYSIVISDGTNKAVRQIVVK